ncbi:hypothetical protein H0H87_004760 [Tephrocybe sp. NHM501043]|nr:hypothetical protein H0H87_004760 [Tephrocybe sp. NHM501043]
MSKRAISHLLNDDMDSLQGSTQSADGSLRPSRRPKLVKTHYPSSLDYPDISKPITQQTPFQQPTPVISFSYTPSRVLQFDDSALRYYVDPPREAKLGHGYQQWVRKPDGRGRIDGLLQAFAKARSESGVPLQDVGVVAWRGVMTKILTSPYEEREGWELNVMSVNGILYFEEHLSEERLKEKNDMEPRHRLQTYYGYAFESYCTSETPTRKVPSNPSEPVGWGGDVDTNVQWCSVVRTKLGNTRLLIGGEVDCVRERYTHQTDNFVELKTSLAIRGANDEAKFEKYIGISLLEVVGFRTPSGVVTTIQSFKTIQLPRLVRGKPDAWDPLICLAWGDKVITSLKDIVRNEVSQDASVWRVKFTPRKGIAITMLDPIDVKDVRGGEDRVGFLPTWYWQESQAAGAHKEAEAVATPAKPPAAAPLVTAGWQV